MIDRYHTAHPLRRGMRVLRRCLPVALLVALIPSGCFFSPRDAEDSEGNGVAGEYAKSPDEVISMLRTAYENIVLTNYELLLAEDFLFVPDRSDSTALADEGVTSYNSAWLMEDEKETFERLIACFANYSTRAGGMIFDYTGDPVLTDSSVTGYSKYDSDYRLAIHYQDIMSEHQDSLVFDGSMTIFIRDDGDAFRIYRWDDFRKGSLSTWGFYKGMVAGSQSYCPELQENK